MPHVAEESPQSLLLHAWVPAVVAFIALVISLVADLARPGLHWTQRSGSIVTVIGGYVAYIDAKRSSKFINRDLYLNPELPYKRISTVMIIIGTLTWGYADLLL